MSARVTAAILLSVATAFFYALSNVLEMLEAEQVPEEYMLKAGLITRLVKRPRWLLGLLSDVFGFLCQAAALGLAAVVFVEPILALGILMALFLGAAFTHRPVERADWMAALVLSAGLAVFLYEVSPTGGTDVGERSRWLLVGAFTCLLIAICIAAGRATTGPTRAAFLGTAAGLAFGISALLTKGLMHYLGDGLFAWVTHWEPYALAVSAIGGVIVAQSALQTGALGAAVGATEATGPISAAVLGLLLLNERVSTDTGFEAVAVVLSVGAVLWGVIALAQAEARMLDENNAEQGMQSIDGMEGAGGAAGC
jgi:drug/metabolite transporter (DMT)-like permease